MTARRLTIIAGAIVLSAAIVLVLWPRRAHVVSWFTKVSGRSAPAGAAADSPPAAARGDVSLDPRRQQMTGVRTVTVKRTTIGGAIRTAGAVRYDETRLADVNVKVEGWIRDLYVDYTGQPIRAGEPLFTLYSPALLATESEYLLALKTREQVQTSEIPDAREQADRLVASARRRLALWDLPAEAIQKLEQSREPEDAVIFRAPVNGVVTEKTAVKGLHVTAGQTLYKIADLSVVWVEADVYEQELPLVKTGQPGTVTLDAYPSERFSGKVIYIYPYVNEPTRTNRVRLSLPNPNGRLKPGMYASVELQAAAGSGLTVPVDAVLDSGTEQVVFVAEGEGHFSPRTVKAGRRFGGRIQILDGLREGEEVATGATFFLDSESQLRAGIGAYQATSSTASAPAQAALVVTLRTEPPQAIAGENVFIVNVKKPDGTPVGDADVSVQLFMPAMPAMSMPAMRNEVKLAATANGEYRGTGQVLIAGRWDAAVIVSKAGQRLGSTQTTVAAR